MSGIWKRLDEESPEEALADEERRAARIRVESAASRRRIGLDSDPTPCSTSGVETTDPYLSLVGDTGGAGALATCNLCGARLRLEHGVPGPRFPVHRPGETIASRLHGAPP